MKPLLFVLCVVCLSVKSHALSVPYFIEATLLDDTVSVHLSWRNNSTDYDTIVILKKEGEDGAFYTVDKVDGADTSYEETNLLPSTLYTYVLLAVAGADTSDSGVFI